MTPPDGAPGEPRLDASFAVLRRAVLPVRDIVDGATTPAAVVARHGAATGRVLDAALAIASPALQTALAAAAPTPSARRAAARYVHRCAGRTAPFGWFACYTLLDDAACTDLAPTPWTGLAARVAAPPEPAPVAAINGLRWRVGGRLRYLVPAGDASPPGYAVREVAASPALEALLDVLAPAADDVELVRHLAAHGIPAARADALLAELAALGLVRREVRRPLRVAPDGDDFTTGTAQALAARGAPAGGRALLREPRAVTLGLTDRDAIGAAAHALLTVGASATYPELDAFHARFVARYERARVPVLQALDPQSGIGLGPLDLETAPPSDARIATLAALLARGVAARGRPVVLGPRDVAALAASDVPRWEGAHFVGALLDPAAAGGACVHAQLVAGGSGLRMLGRLADGDRALACAMRAHHERLHASRDAQAVAVELVHGAIADEWRTGMRVAPATHELQCVPLPTMPDVVRLTLADIALWSDGTRLRLWSERLGREIAVRTTCAQVPSGAGWLAAYRLLEAMQHGSGTVVRTWQWGPLAALPYTPEVRLGTTVLCAARWALGPGDPPPAGDAAAWARWLASPDGPPATATLVVGEERHLVQLAHDLDRELVCHAVATHGGVVLEALPGGVEALRVRDHDGARYVSEVVVPMVLRRTPEPASRPGDRWSAAAVSPPGGAWWYARLYTGASWTGPVLAAFRDVVAHAAGPAPALFFVRYADPQPHLRVRVRLPSSRDEADRWRARLDAVVAALMADGRIAHATLDTWVPELDRYGGTAGHAAAIDSFVRQTRLWFAWMATPVPMLATVRAAFAEGLVAAAVRAPDGRRACVLAIVGRWDRIEEAGRWRRADRAATTRHRGAGAGGAAAVAWHCGARLGARLHALDADGRLTADLEGIVESHVHMMTNRWADADWPAAEYAVWCQLRRRVLRPMPA